jgi:hypothetical protein
MLKAAIQKNRNIGLPLLSARCIMRKQLKRGKRDSVHRWSAVRPFAQSVLSKCLAAVDDIPLVEVAERWTGCVARISHHLL